MRRLVGIALLLKQRGILAIFARLRPVATHVCQIEGGRVSAAHEAHEIRGGQEVSGRLDVSHYTLPLRHAIPTRIASTDRKFINSMRGVNFWHSVPNVFVAKAQDLLRLARMAASRRAGIGLEEICEEFGVSHRTAQRMTEALEDRVHQCRQRRMPRTADGAGVLPTPARAAAAPTGNSHRSAGNRRPNGARRWPTTPCPALEDLRDGLLARLTPRDALRTEADVEAVLAGMGSVTRPGPTRQSGAGGAGCRDRGLRGPFRLRSATATRTHLSG